MGNFGGEILIVLVIALLVFGPKNLPEVGRTLGRTVRSVMTGIEQSRGQINSVMSDVRDVVNSDEVKSIRESSELRELRELKDSLGIGDLKDLLNMKNTLRAEILSELKGSPGASPSTTSTATVGEDVPSVESATTAIESAEPPVVAKADASGDRVVEVTTTPTAIIPPPAK